LVFDATLPPPALPPEIATRSTAENTIIVLNKSDLNNFCPLPDCFEKSARTSVSALTGAGLDDLTTAIVRLADSFQTVVGNDQIAINARHAHALGQARQWLTDAQAKLTTNGPVELLASDLRGVLTAYGEISGKVDNERMLDALFATFCIGK
jgi:tRNA modification GTPase